MIGYREDEPLGPVVREIRRRRRVLWRDWTIFLIGVALIAAVAVL